MASSIEIDVSANIAKFKTAMDRASMEGNKLNKNLNKAFGGIKTAMRAVGALAGVAVVGGLVSMTKSSINAADAIQKLGIRTGASAEFLSEMRFALSQSDVSTKEFANSLVKLNKSSQDAADGLSTPKRAFEKLGISVTAFNKLGTDQKFIELSEAISRIKDPAVRSQTAMDLLGRSGSQLLTVMNDGAAGLDRYRQESVKLGQSLSQDQVDKAAAANDALDKLSKTISGSFSQAVLNNIGFIEKFGEVIGNIEVIGISMVEGLLVGFEHIKSASKIAGAGLKLAFMAPIGIIMNMFGRMVEQFGKFSSIFGENEVSRAIKEFGRDVQSVINPLDDFSDRLDDISSEKERAISAIKALTGEMAAEALAADVVTASIKKTTDSVNVFTAASEEASKEIRDGLIKSLEQTTNGLANAEKRFGDFDTAAEVVTNTVKNNNREFNKNSIILQELNKQFKDGVITQGEYEAASKSLGKTSEEVTDTMGKSWERFADGAFDSFKTFTKSAFTDFKSFGDSLKDLAKDIVADLIATFASNKLKQILSTLFKDISKVKSGEQTSGGTSGNIGTQIASSIGSSVVSIGSRVATSIGSALGIGAAAGTTTALASIGAAGIVPTIGFGAGAVSTTIAANTAASFATAGTVASGAGTTAGTVAAGTGSGFASTLAAAAPYLLAAAVLIGALSGNSRSPQELGEDQLQAVSDATEAGRNTQVALGQAAGTSVSYLGAFDENSTFFGVDLLKDQLQEVGNVLQERFGFNQALALKDGIIRLEDFTRNFSENNDTIVSEVKAAIVEVELSITDLERTTIASLGSTLVEVDRLFDSTAGSGETTAERISNAYAMAFDTTSEAGNEWLLSTQLSADRIAEIFNESSAEVTEALFGVTENGAVAFQQLADGAARQAGAINQSFGGIGGQLTIPTGSAQGIRVSPELEARLAALTDAMLSGNDNDEFLRAANANR